ncbi:MAG: MlaD family protein [Planctomycetota bacterium]|jgi:phospholipid/cholesterol/gamma-HCH transport system substrate-binding protein
MDERVVQLRIGLMVLVTLIITVFLLLMFGGERNLFQAFQTGQVYYVQFSETPGITQNTAVQKSGIRIGQVTEVRLPDEVDPDDLPPAFGGVLPAEVGAVVTIEIDGDRRIYTNEVCTIQRTLIGDAVLSFIRARPRPPQPVVRKDVEPGAWLVGQLQADPIQIVGNLEADLSKAIVSIADTSDEIRELAEKVGKFLGEDEEIQVKEDRLKQIMDQASSMMKQIETAATNVNDVLGDPDVRRQLRHSITQFPDLLVDVRDVLGKMRSSLDGMDTTIGLVNENLTYLEGFTKPLGERGEALVDRLDRGAYKFELIGEEVLAFTKALNSREGSLGQLIHNPELYDNLNQTVANVEDMTVEFRPIVRNLRIFSDTLARHPERIGVGGAIRPSSGAKDIPSTAELLRSPSPSKLFSPFGARK